MMKHFLTIPLLLVLLTLSSCWTSNPQQRISARYTDSFETECIGVELDGSQTVKAWGNGRFRRDAVEQAYKNAVRDVLFKGITKGRGGCNMKPIVTDPNAQEKHAEYFNRFFEDGGVYQEFVDKRVTADGGVQNIEVYEQRKLSGSQESAYGINVRVLRPKLVERMRTQGIIQ
jgi:hypothetical protein